MAITLKIPSLSEVRNYMFPTSNNPQQAGDITRLKTGSVVKDLRNYISPVQLLRIRHDIKLWRDAVLEAENAFFPHRVRMQQMFLDTVLNGHTLACVQKRKDLSLLRQWNFQDKNEKVNDELNKLFSKPWFSLWLEYALEAKFFGYSLITLGDCVNNEFPDLGIIRRFNVSPDRLNVSAYIYAIQGDLFMEPPFNKWHTWISTPSTVGVSKVGYGELYSVAQYEILARNLLGQNADATELYGAPFRKAKTTKTGDDRIELSKSLQEMGSSGSIITDMMDEIELVESKGNGAGFKLFPDLEKRLENKISKLLLGHADAIDSIPGKLGNSTKKSPAEMALIDKQTNDGIFLENAVNSILIPKLIDIGFVIDKSYRWTLDNNQEKVEARQNDDQANLVTAQIALAMKNAGLQYDAAAFEAATGIKTSAIVAPAPMDKFTPEVKNKLKKHFKFIENIYSSNGHHH